MKKNIFLSTLLPILLPISLLANDSISTAVVERQVPVSFGHNLTATSHVMNEGGCTFGFQVAGCGVSEKLSLVTSPWLIGDYNSYNFFARYQYEKNEDRVEAVQLAVFKSFGGEYDMFAAWLTWIRGYLIRPGYNLFLNVQFANYFEEERPFSLRRPRIWGTSTELSISTLHEVELVNGFYIQGEVGVLGVVRKYPLLHTGASMQWRSQRWLIQAGFSMTGTIHALFSPNRRFDSAVLLSNGDDHKVESSSEFITDFIKYDFSVHPEIAVQYFF